MMGDWAGVSRERVGAILAHCADLKLGVVGDLGLDAYWYADMTRSFLSRETPRFPRPIVREAYSPGAGANVANNLHTIGVGQVVAFSVLGDDWRGKLLSDVLAEVGVDCSALIVSPDRSTTTYVKPMLQGYDAQQEDARLDFENDHPLLPALEDALIETLRRWLPDLDGLIVADQLEVNGIVTERVRAALNGFAAEHSTKQFVVDSRCRIGLYQHMVLKPNNIEAASAFAPERASQPPQPGDLARIGESASARYGRPVFITLGEDGVLVCADGEHRHLPAAPVQPPLDIVGAGDAFIAALTSALAVGATPWEAGALANLAAAVVVEKLNQTGTASPEEILARYDRAHASETP